jgi:hypothetical protein
MSDKSVKPEDLVNYNCVFNIGEVKYTHNVLVSKKCSKDDVETKLKTVLAKSGVETEKIENLEMKIDNS